ncbi:MAG: DUF2059 domain-containing protein [Bacteroidota bacterium]
MKALKFIAIFVLVFSTSMVQAQEDAFADDIMKFLQINGSKATFQVTIKQMMQQFQTMAPDLTVEQWQTIEEEVINPSYDDLQEKFIPIYKKHFTHEEIKKLIDFYQTDLGEKLASKQPVISGEAMQIAQAWGMELGQNIQLKIQEMQAEENQ